MKQQDFYNSAAWRYCAKYVLLYYSVDGMVQCSTSGRWYHLPDRNIVCGHYYHSDQHRSVCLEFNNLGPQSYSENRYFSGRPEVMRQWLIKQHGLKAIELLDIKKNNAMKLDKFTLDYYKDYYKNLFNELVKVKGNPWLATSKVI
jgi:hypothetical protein